MSNRTGRKIKGKAKVRRPILYVGIATDAELLGVSRMTLWRALRGKNKKASTGSELLKRYQALKKEAA